MCSKKFITIFMTSFMITTSYANIATSIGDMSIQQLEEIIETLEKARTENDLLSTHVTSWLDKMEVAVDNVDVFKFVDVLLEALWYSLTRLRHHMGGEDELKKEDNTVEQIASSPEV